MTADEIRKVVSLSYRPLKWWQRIGLSGRTQAFFLQEIAAQLAELNERLKPLDIRDRTFEYPEGRP
jgi:hypothetical protein